MLQQGLAAVLGKCGPDHDETHVWSKQFAALGGEEKRVYHRRQLTPSKGMPRMVEESTVDLAKAEDVPSTAGSGVKLLHLLSSPADSDEEEGTTTTTTVTPIM